MTTKTLANLATLAVLLASGSSSSVATAQKPIPVKILTLPCCRCVDGSTQTVSINTGSTAWTMQPPTGPAFAAPVYHNMGWTTGAAPAQWVGVGATPGVQGTYVFQLRFRVPNCVIKPTITASGIFSADNGGTVTVAGSPVVGTAPQQTAFQNTFPFTGFVTAPGIHAVQVTVYNQGGPVGAVVKGTITIRCPRSLVHPDRPEDQDPARRQAEPAPQSENPGSA